MIFPHRGNIYRPTRGPDANRQDRVTIPSTATATGIRGFLQQKKGRVKNDQLGSYLEYDAIFFAERGSNIKPRVADDEKDQLIVTDKSGASLGTYLVQFVGDESGMNNHLTCYVCRHRAK